MTQVPTARPEQFAVPLNPLDIGFSGPPAGNASVEPRLRHYWRTLYKNRWIIAGVVTLCLSIALIITLAAERKYTGTVRIQIDRQAPKIVDMEQVGDQLPSGADVEFYQTQYALLKSRSLSQAVVFDLTIWNSHIFRSWYEETESEKLSSLPVRERVELATTMVNLHTGVTPVRGSSIVDVHYVSPDPALSAHIANAMARNFIKLNLDRRYEAAAYAREFLQDRLNQVRARLEQSERKAVQYAQRQGLIKIAAGTVDNPAQQSLLANDLAQLSTQLTEARAARAEAEAQFRQGTAGSAAAQSLASTTVNNLREQRAGGVGQLTKLEADFGPEYPAVVALRSQIGELDRQIAREESRVRSSVAQDIGGRFQQAVAAERALQSRVDGLKASLLGEQGRSIQFNILQRDVDTNRALYDALLQRFKEVGIAGGVGTNNVSIVDLALQPEKPSSPNAVLNIALALLIGLVLGALAAIAREHLAEAVILPAEFESKLRIPLLGSTPRLGRQLNGGQRLIGSRRQRNSQELARIKPEDHPELMESYFSILTAVQYSTSTGAPRTLGVTSSGAGEGKSTTAVALARGLGRLGRRVLLIDADMRNPSLHRAVGIEREAGLSDILSAHAQLEDVINETHDENLWLVTAGKLPPNPAELLAGARLKRILAAATELFDHVIVDSPPLLGLADAPLIAAVTEGTVFVVEAGRASATEARHALNRLDTVGAHVVGAVLTKFDSRDSGYGETYGYTYRYGTAAASA